MGSQDRREKEAQELTRRVAEQTQAEIARQLRHARATILDDDPECDRKLARLAMHERRMHRAVEVMDEYFDAHVEHYVATSRHGREYVPEVRREFANLREWWFRHFLGQVDENAVYHPHPGLAKWPQKFPFSLPNPPIQLDLGPTAKERAADQEQAQNDSEYAELRRLRRENGEQLDHIAQLKHERHALQRKVAELEGQLKAQEEPEDELDDFVRVLDRLAGPDADAEEYTEDWIQKKTEQFAERIPKDDPARQFKVSRYGKRLQKQAEAALEVWRKDRKDAPEDNPDG